MRRTTQQKLKTEKIGRIYGRTRGRGIFRPVDVRGGKFVINVIHATTYWNEEQITVAENEVLPHLRQMNPELEFELRRV